MALTPQNNDAFFREVDEELRRDQASTLWQRYGKIALAAIAVLLLALAAFLWWQHDRRQKAGAEGEAMSQLLADLSEGKKAGVQPKLDALAQSPRDGYRAMAQLTAAGLALDGKDMKAAAAKFGAVAADDSLPQATRDLALVRQTAAEFDTLPPQTVVDRLKPIAVAGNPWFGSAGELVGLAYLKLNQKGQAGTVFAALVKDEAVPLTIRSRAARMAAGLGMDVTPPENGAKG